MPRYIDADAIIKNAEKWGKNNPNRYIEQRNSDIVIIIKNEPTADVIPREKIDEMTAELHLWLKQHYCFAEEGVMDIIHKYCDKENKDGRIS